MDHDDLIAIVWEVAVSIFGEHEPKATICDALTMQDFQNFILFCVSPQCSRRIGGETNPHLYEAFHDALYKFSLNWCKLVFWDKLFAYMYKTMRTKGMIEQFIMEDEGMRPMLDLHMKLADHFLAQ